MATLLMLTSTFPRWDGDSTPAFVLYLATSLAAKGHEVHVLAPHAQGAAAEEQLGPLRVHRFRYAPSTWERLAYGGGIPENLRRKPILWALVPFFFVAEFAATVRLARRTDPDVVHAHWFLPQGLVASTSKWLLRCPVLLSAHGADLLTARGIVKRFLIKKVVESTDACTVNSSAMTDVLAGITRRPATLLPMGVDPSRFEYRADHHEGAIEHLQLLFVGRLAEKKGLRYLLEAMPLITRVKPYTTLTVIGEGPELAGLRTRASQLSLTDHVRFLGGIPNGQLPDYYRRAHIFVAPSVMTRDGDTEALGVVLLEAGASGLPIVTSNVGGIGDVVRHEETGLLVEPGVPAALADAILRLADDAELRQQLAVNVRARVVQHFSWDSVAGRFDALIRELTGTHSSPTRAASR